MTGFIPDITTRITVNVNTDNLDEGINRIESDKYLSQCPSLIETLKAKKQELENIKQPLASSVADRLQSNQEIIIATKHYISGMMANSVDISEDGEDYLVGNTAHSVDGFPYPLAINNGRRGGYEVRPITFDYLHWIDKKSQEDVFAKVSHPGPVEADPFVENSINKTITDINEIVSEQIRGIK